MPPTPHIQSAVKITNLLLIRSEFERVIDIDFSKEPKNQFTIDVKTQVNDLILVVYVTAECKQMNGEEQEVFIRVTFAGVFESSAANLDLDTFGKINGAAIVYPYVREHISILSLKAGIRHALLPVVNYTDQEYPSEAK